ncbi:hypothetical protein AXFE_02030 [Acidithrix ferrooxidans]|uniref:Uncharacterized protein n=1 Tax=Acidithrix ferrooxidans TaxID=1280514 RepID=A0A0D8HP80_9ACTN|nr:hypothetical protein AXFE_02030 [Acidithrix ferrooxidans]
MPTGCTQALVLLKFLTGNRNVPWGLLEEKINSVNESIFSSQNSTLGFGYDSHRNFKIAIRLFGRRSDTSELGYQNALLLA